MSKRSLEKAVALIKEFEGCRLKAYKDPVGIWTIGYGRTKGVKPGMVQTQSQADADLLADLERRGARVEKLLKVKVNDHQFGALLSFAYNLGLGGLKKSRVLAMVNDGVPDSPERVAKEFGRYCHAGGKVLKGLVRRRAAEAKLYSTK